METNDNFETLKDKEKEEGNMVDKLLVRYVMKYCGCPGILLIIFPLLNPIFFFIVHSISPYKQIVEIDKTNNILIIYFLSLIPCCKLSARNFNLSDIGKIRIYVYSIPDPRRGFSKLYFINCEIFSRQGEKEMLFSGVPYEKEAFERFSSFFNKYFETEIEPIETAKDLKEYNIMVGNNYYPGEAELMIQTP